MLIPADGTQMDRMSDSLRQDPQSLLIASISWVYPDMLRIGWKTLKNIVLKIAESYLVNQQYERHPIVVGQGGRLPAYWLAHSL